MRQTPSVWLLLLFYSLCIAFTVAYLQSDFPIRDLEPFVLRPDFCAGLEWRSLPNATVVITVMNEEHAMIERNVRSILAKTPPHLLDSIIVVDDFSEFLPVSNEILKYPKVQLVRNDRPLGVAGGRIAGAEKGQGEVLIFLDAQMEVTEGWIEPLLGYVDVNPRSVATCIIDMIDENDGTYTSREKISLVSMIPSGLDFKWTSPVTHNGYVLYTPVLLGSAFAIRRSWFDEGGKYDPENRVWGIENIEMSVRVWTCGGDIVAMPCSHVGHYFRNTRKFKSPRFDDPDFYHRNAVRFAEVWMDEHAELFYKGLARSRSWIDKERTNPNLNQRKQLRKEMKCKSFAWYYNIIVKGIMELYDIEIPGHPHQNLTLVESPKNEF